MSYMMVGDEIQYVKNKNQVPPCDWVKEKVQIVNNEQKGKEKDRFRALFELCSKLYYHTLFPRWPKLTKQKWQFDRKIKIKNNPQAEQGYLEGFFSVVTSNRLIHSSTISKIILGDFGGKLDPADYSGRRIATSSGDISVEDVEERFSHSIELGKTVIKHPRLSKIERKQIEFLHGAEKFLEDSTLSSNDAKLISEIKRSIQLFSSRFVKRSLGVKYGFYKNVDELKYYSKVLNDKFELSKLKRIFENLINNGGTFEMSLVTTFGQPEPSDSKNAIFKVTKVPVNLMDLKKFNNNRPNELLRYFRVKERAVPLTFDLCSALQKTSKGLIPASLPEGIFAFLDSVRAQVLGQLVRDQDLIEQAEIVIGNTGEIVRYDKIMKFSVEKD